MDNKIVHNREKILAALRNRAVEHIGEPDIEPFQNFFEQKINHFLNEIQIFQVELEMQNEELKESYNSIEQERAKFSDFFDLAPVGYFILDHVGEIEQANQTGIDLLKVNKLLVIGNRIQRFIDSEDWSIFYNFLNQIQRSDEKQSCELRLNISDAPFTFVRVEGKAVQGFLSKDTKYYITITDISESFLAAQALKETTERLTLTLKASKTGTWSLDSKSKTIYLDDFSKELLGFGQWTFDGSYNIFFDIVHPEDQERVRDIFLNSSKNLDLEYRILTKSNEIKYIEAKGHRIDKAGLSSYFVGVIIDCTEQKKIIIEKEEFREEQQRILLSAILKAQEKERNKISEALHNSIGQLLYGSRLRIQSLEKNSPLKPDLQGISILLEQAIKETRNISHELIPSILRDFGFSAAIIEMAHRLSQVGFLIRHSISDVAEKLNPEVQLYIFRIIQELLNNIIKHSEATSANILLESKNNLIYISVSDNGKGFKVEAEEQSRNGSGIRGIKNRIFLLNGDVEFLSTKTGTTVNIKFDYTQTFNALA